MKPKVFNIAEDGSLEYRVIAGPQTVVDNNVYDADQTEDFWPATGTVGEQEQFSEAGGLKKFVSNWQANRKRKQDSKAKLREAKGQAKIIKAGAKQTTAEAKVEASKANQIAAKGLSKPDPVSKMKVIKKTSTSEKPGMSTGVKVGIAIGVVAILTIVTIIIIKKRKKK